jgi:hypothetical protein
MRDRGSQRTKSPFKFLGGQNHLDWTDGARTWSETIGIGGRVWNLDTSAVSTKCDASATASPQLKAYHPAKLDTSEEREQVFSESSIHGFWR